MIFFSVFGGLKPAQLRRLRHGYAAVTPETRVVTQVTRKSFARVRERYTSNITNMTYVIYDICHIQQKNHSFTEQNIWRNRVTCVTTGILGVTVA